MNLRRRGQIEESFYSTMKVVSPFKLHTQQYKHFIYIHIYTLISFILDAAIATTSA